MIYLDYQATTPLAPEVADSMRPWLEEKFANRKGAEIRRTRFAVRPAGKGYAFYVVDQTYLR